jgi:hypothetical protein
MDAIAVRARSVTGCAAAVSARRSRNRPTSKLTDAAADPAADAHRPSTSRPTAQRNVAERCINRLKQWRGLAMCTDKLAVHYQAALTLAGILPWTKRRLLPPASMSHRRPLRTDSTTVIHYRHANCVAALTGSLSAAALDPVHGGRGVARGR